MEILYKDTNDNALDNAISETTVPLPPIGKALHVLLNVSQHVFDEAAKNDTTQSEHILPTSLIRLTHTCYVWTAPTARAFRALNEYLNQGQFTDIFDPLQVVCDTPLNFIHAALTCLTTVTEAQEQPAISSIGTLLATLIDTSHRICSFYTTRLAWIIR